MQPRLPEPLQRQPVGDREGEDVLLEQRVVQHAVAAEPLELGRLADFERQLFGEELLQAGQLEGVAQADHVRDLRVAVRVGEVAERPLHLADEVVEHRLEGREDLRQLGATWWRSA